MDTQVPIHIINNFELSKTENNFELSKTENTIKCPEYNAIEKKKKKKKNRCHFADCNKKLGVVKCKCKCGFIFCTLHRMPESHECTFDHTSYDKEILSKKLVKVEADKVIRI